VKLPAEIMTDAARGRLSPAVTPVPLPELAGRLHEAVHKGARVGLFTARRRPGSGDPGRAGDRGISLETLVIDPAAGVVSLWETALPPGARDYPSLTTTIPQMHWFERAVHDFFGVVPMGHPRFKSLILHDSWPLGYHPLREVPCAIPDDESPRRSYEFLTVKGEGVYEVPVGPIHAGIIEPGHFRFSCLGEAIHNLEIRLGYVHRGVEETLTRVPWKQTRFVAEAASSDTTVANALAHSLALEQILKIHPPPGAPELRAIALEMERIASHISDLGGICGDIGFTAGAAIFGRLRGAALGLLERLTGARFGAAYILPGGVSRPLSAEMRDNLLRQADCVSEEFARAEPLLLENSGALERMTGTGWVRHSLAREFGLVGPAGRASGIDYDVRRALRQEPYNSLEWEVAGADSGDVLARAGIRVDETRTSLSMVSALLRRLNARERPEALRLELPAGLPPDSVGAGIVESWRGELVHLIFTDGAGLIDRCSIKDPSFNNWTGLAVAVRGELLSDFPLCNKSFGLSYSGNDL